MSYLYSKLNHYSSIIYQNQEKIDDLLSKIKGNIIEIVEKEIKQSKEQETTIGTKLGGLLAMIGIGEIKGSMKRGSIKDATEKVIGKLSNENKMKFIGDYYRSFGEFSVIDMYNTPKVLPEIKRYGHVLGPFRIFDINGEEINKAELISFIMKVFGDRRDQRSMWILVLKTKFEKNITVEIPVLATYFMPSQHFILSLHKYTKTHNMSFIVAGLLGFDPQRKFLKVDPLIIRHDFVRQQ